MNKPVKLLLLGASFALFANGSLFAQELKPEDNGIFGYHTAPRYSPSEEHPLRILAYAAHPFGWVAREGITRPLSALFSSGEFMKSFFGFREPNDFRRSECFSNDSSIPDCRALVPFNYDNGAASNANAETNSDASASAERNQTSSLASSDGAQIYFPDVNFDFNRHGLNELGKGRAHQIYEALKSSGAVNVVLEGHTDYKGSDAYNEKLGLDRAETVKQELIALGVPADKIATVSFGKTRPVLKDEESWAAAVNRRVEVRFKSDAKAQANLN